MLFSSLVFLYFFLPISLIGYYLLPSKFRNTFLFFISIVFFAWGGVSYSLILLLSIVFNFFVGLLIERQKRRRMWLGVGVSLDLLLLVVFKYANFLIDNLNAIFSWINIPTVNNPSILLPIGISFYTFQAISYLIDVYRGTTKAQSKIINLGLYISLFPQLIAGPIVRYFDIHKQIKKREYSVDLFTQGIQRFILGFAKKILVANSMGFVADEVFSLQLNDISSSLAWIGIIAYSMQIYYDFAGYSDMAIGLAKMFGFNLLENFNFPYISKSIQEFWRRWHISLSNWFRDYLYIPLGGNRNGKNRTIVNLFIVFFVTGFWHGASWNFLVWGLMHGLFLVLERTNFGSFIKRIPTVFQSLYVLFVVIMAWVCFRSESLAFSLEYYKIMFGATSVETDAVLISKLLTKESMLLFTIALAGAFGVFQKFHEYLNHKFSNLLNYKTVSVAKTLVIGVFIVFVLLYGTGSLVLGAYNPFIYFRF